MRRLACVTLWAAVALGSGGCQKREEVSPRLQPIESCEDLAQTLREDALEQMNQALDSNLAWALRAGDRCRDHHGGVYGTPQTSGGGGCGCGGGSVLINNTAEGDRAIEASGTNNQVPGVEEPDFVKNDDRHIYVASGGHLRIIEAWPAPAAQEVAKVALEGEPRKLLLTRDHLLVYASLKDPESEEAQEVPPEWPSGAVPGASSECTYGYSCSFTGDGNPSLITIFDIKDRTAPKKVRELRLSGSLVNARQVGSAVFLVVSNSGASVEYEVWPALADCDRSTVAEAFARLRAANEATIRAAEVLPAVSDRIISGQKRQWRSCEGFYNSSLADGQQLTTVVGLDMDQLGPIRTATVVSRPGAVYAAAGALYIAVPHEQTGNLWYPGMSDFRQATAVHKFGLTTADTRPRYLASGVVKGRVLNQFAMDEHQGYLRIATTTGYSPSPDAHSTLTVLEQRGPELTERGQMDGLAPTEDIRSVRFAGERGFIVTFKQTDPLFVIDLSRPTSPRLLAELKIPGFSTYMQMMDESHLLTIGYDGDDQGIFAWFAGVRLQIFDVSDPTSPRLAHKEVIGTRGSSSDALTDHLAFNYFAQRNLLALPMTICEGSDEGGVYGDTMSFSGLMVYDAAATTGFKLRGKVAHPPDPEITCNTWSWTDASSQVERSIILADSDDSYVFSISRRLVKVNHLDNLTVDLASIPIAD